MEVKKGNMVKVHYTGTLDDGNQFDSSEGKDPLEFEAGSGQVIKGFDEAVIGMKKDEEKEVKIESKDAYGPHQPEMVKKFPRDQLPKEKEPEVGMVLQVGTPQGQQMLARIIAVDEKEVTIDLNHPLAGQNLNFKLKVVDISEKKEEEKKE